MYVSWFSTVSGNGFVVPFDINLHVISSAYQWLSGGPAVVNIATVANSGVCTIFWETSRVATPFYNVISAKTVTVGGTVGTAYDVVNMVGLASKAIYYMGQMYFLAAFGIDPSLASTYPQFQQTYFLINGSTSTAAAPIAIAKLAYSNGGGLLQYGLPSISINNSELQIAYLYKDLIVASGGGQTYAQTGANLVSFAINITAIDAVELANTLNFTGGFGWMYDGMLPVENNFFLYPDSVGLAGSTASGGGLTLLGTYYYQVCYEWMDNQGNLHRSTPSVTTSLALTGTQNTITLSIAPLGLTYKASVKVMIYRASTATATFYLVTPPTATPVLNNPAASAWITYVDKAADSSIVGNTILYTTGGTVGDTNGPASNIMTSFDTRLWMVDAEDPNILWYSKQVIGATPVEMSDLFTLYVAPTVGSLSTGGITAIAAMDEKLIIFKGGATSQAIFYINGNGPDNTGANSQYSEPIFITSTVGCNTQASIVLTPAGLMFQSAKGIWLLDRNLQTSYIGAAVEAFNNYTVLSAVNVPAQNQARFILSNGMTLMYDYFYGVWGTFTNTPGISSTIYQGQHTYINSTGVIFQETPGVYLDGANQIQMSFTTSWFNLAGLQGYERIYDFYLLGVFISPHNLLVSVAYDYGPITQQVLIQPNNYGGTWGSDATWGSTSPWGGVGSLEQWRIHTNRQTCQSFQITVLEQFNPVFNTIPGAGLTLSGLTCRVGLKKGIRPVQPTSSIG
jgi:hypothetical protein